MIKRFVLDTNILLQSPTAMTEGFDDNYVIVTGTTLQELDAKKDFAGDVGYNAREAGRILDELRTRGNLVEGVPLANGGRLFVEPDGVKQAYLPDGFDIKVPDNRIISSCIHINKRLIEQHEAPVILITNDILMRVNATICGVQVEEYRNDQIQESGYIGHEEIIVESDYGYINELYHEKQASAKQFTEVGIDLVENEFVTIRSGSQSALTIYKNGDLHLIEQQRVGWVKPLNAMQSYAMYALSAPPEEIPLVILSGVAGSAKTFLSLASGLEQTYTGQGKNRESRYNKILLSKPSISFGEMGYLPGGMDEKMIPALASYMDNLENLLRGKEGKDEDMAQIKMQIQEMFDDGILEICALSLIRGRSLKNCMLICDEAQNANKTLIRDVITRAGEGVKVVIAGDPDQIDIPNLDSRNNGLVYALECMKGSPTTAIVTFDAKQAVRSVLSKEAVKRMKI